MHPGMFQVDLYKTEGTWHNNICKQWKAKFLNKTKIALPVLFMLKYQQETVKVANVSTFLVLWTLWYEVAKKLEKFYAPIMKEILSAFT